MNNRDESAYCDQAIAFLNEINRVRHDGGSRVIDKICANLQMIKDMGKGKILPYLEEIRLQIQFATAKGLKDNDTELSKDDQYVIATLLNKIELPRITKKIEAEKSSYFGENVTSLELRAEMIAAELKDDKKFAAALARAQASLFTEEQNKNAQIQETLGIKSSSRDIKPGSLTQHHLHAKSRPKRQRSPRDENQELLANLLKKK